MTKAESNKRECDDTWLARRCISLVKKCDAEETLLINNMCKRINTMRSCLQDEVCNKDFTTNNINSKVKIERLRTSTDRFIVAPNSKSCLITSIIPCIFVTSYGVTDLSSLQFRTSHSARCYVLRNQMSCMSLDRQAHCRKMAKRHRRMWQRRIVATSASFYV